MERIAQETHGLYWFGPPLGRNTLLRRVVWCIASWAVDDGQYKEEQPREGLFLWWCCPFGGVDSRCLYTMVASPIYRVRGPGPLPNIEREGREQLAILKGNI